MTTVSAGEIARRLGGERERAGYWTARCPAHEDAKASLSLKDGRDGVLWKCHAGCTQEAVMTALRAADIFADTVTVRRASVRVTTTPVRSSAPIVATYDYTDESGELLYQSVRKEPKDFYQRQRQADGTWANHLRGVRLVPYRLPDIVTSIGKVYVVEGEKDVDALRAWGLVATCNPMGAGKWLPAYSEHLTGRDVVILPDNDGPGRTHADSILRDLEHVASRVRLVNLPGLPDKGDVSDWIAAGGTREQLEQLVRDAPTATWSTAPVITITPLTDLGNAERLVRRHGRDIRWVPDWKSWLVWNGRYWERDTDGAIMRLMFQVVRAIPEEANDEGTRKFAARSEGLQRLGAAIEVAKSLPGIAVRSDALNQNRDIVVVRDGTVELRTRTVREHRREDLVTTVMLWDGELAWYDDRAACPTWLASLATWQPDGEILAFLQMLAGYALTGHVRERNMVIFWGIGRNGKSTFVEALRATFGDHAHQSSTDLVMQRRGADAGQATPELAVLQGKRLVVMDETSEGGRLDEARVKWITGGDSISARRLYGDPFTFQPTHTIILTTNHRPVIRSGGEAIWDRIQQVPWNTRIEDAQLDRALPQKLLDERPGILSWIVMGASMWYEYGLTPPASVKSATDDYRAGSDWFGLWMDECCVVGEAQMATSKDLHRAYDTWATEAGERDLSIISLGRILSERGFKQARDRRGRRAWQGIGVRADLA